MRFTCSYLLMLALLILPFKVDAQVSERQTSTSTNKNQGPQLQLTTSILDRKFCIGDNDLDLLWLKLNLEFTNIGSEKIILYKDSGRISYVKILGESGTDINEKPVFSFSVTTYFADTLQVMDNTTYSKQFLEMSNNSKFNIVKEVRIPIWRRGDKKAPVGIVPGNYNIQAQATTWLGSYELAREMHEKWKEKGFLWFNPIWSKPMPIVITQNRKVIKCDD